MLAFYGICDYTATVTTFRQGFKVKLEQHANGKAVQQCNVINYCGSRCLCVFVRTFLFLSQCVSDALTSRLHSTNHHRVHSITALICCDNEITICCMHVVDVTDKYESCLNISRIYNVIIILIILYNGGGTMQFACRVLKIECTPPCMQAVYPHVPHSIGLHG